MRVRLTRKLAEAIDGIDLSRRRVGDLVELPQHDAEMLVAEGWATPADSQAHMTAGFGERPYRRAEDRIREELQDSRAKTLHHHRHD